MDKYFPAFFLLLIFIFICAFFYYFYEAVSDYSNRKHQTIYYLNNKHYNRNHNHRLCPKGCTKNKKCPQGNFCYNCKSENPHCCCYDFQCGKC